MPLIRKPYEQEQAEADFKASGQADLGSGQYSQNTGFLEPSKNTYGTGRLPGGFVNTDRLVSANKELIDKARQNVNQLSGDIDSQTAGLRGKLAGGGPSVDSAPGELSVDQILTLAQQNPDELKKSFGWQAKNPDDVAFDDKSYDPILKKITDTTGYVGLNAATPDPFKYGLLKSGGAIQDNTLLDYIDKVKKDRSAIAEETAKYNQTGDERAAAATNAYQDKFKTKLRGILDDILPQLQESRPYAPIAYGEKKVHDNRLTGGEWRYGDTQLTDVMGGTDEQRDNVVKGLRNIGSLLEMDPNTINATPLDKEWFAALEKQKKRQEQEELSKKIRAQEEKEREGTGEPTQYGEAGRHAGRAWDAARYNY